MVRFDDQKGDGGIISWIDYWRDDDTYDDYDVILQTDEHYDKYLKSAIQLQMLKDEPVPLNEPVQVYSNIENGYGVFGSNLVRLKRN